MGYKILLYPMIERGAMKSKGASGSQARGPPGHRRRGSSLEGALLDAAWAELMAVGYQHLTMEGIARRAGTSKPVLYRRWPTRADVVLAAVRRKKGSISDVVPNTGTLEGDVLSFLRQMNRRFSDIPAQVRSGLISEAGQVWNQPVATIIPQVMETILERASKRGELRAWPLPPRLVRLATDLVRHEMVMTDAPVSERALNEIVYDIFLPLVAKRSAIR